jgi:hypothetical protein
VIIWLLWTLYPADQGILPLFTKSFRIFLRFKAFFKSNMIGGNIALMAFLEFTD